MKYFIFKWMDVFKRMHKFYNHIDEYKAKRLQAFINKSGLTGFAFLSEDTIEDFKNLFSQYTQKIVTYTRIDDDIIFEHQLEPKFFLECFDFGEEISKVEYLCYCATYPDSEITGLMKGYHCVGKDLFNDMSIEEK